MPDSTLAALPVDTTPSSSAITYVVDGGVDYQISLSSFVQAALTSIGENTSTLTGSTLVLSGSVTANGNPIITENSFSDTRFVRGTTDQAFISFGTNVNHGLFWDGATLNATINGTGTPNLPFAAGTIRATGNITAPAVVLQAFGPSGQTWIGSSNGAAVINVQTGGGFSVTSNNASIILSLSPTGQLTVAQVVATASINPLILGTAGTAGYFSMANAGTSTETLIGNGTANFATVAGIVPTVFAVAGSGKPVNLAADESGNIGVAGTVNAASFNAGTSNYGATSAVVKGNLTLNTQVSFSTGASIYGAAGANVSGTLTAINITLSNLLTATTVSTTSLNASTVGSSTGTFSGLVKVGSLGNTSGTWLSGVANLFITPAVTGGSTYIYTFNQAAQIAAFNPGSIAFNQPTTVNGNFTVTGATVLDSAVYIGSGVAGGTAGDLGIGRSNGQAYFTMGNTSGVGLYWDGSTLNFTTNDGGATMPLAAGSLVVNGAITATGNATIREGLTVSAGFAVGPGARADIAGDIGSGISTTAGRYFFGTQNAIDFGVNVPGVFTLDATTQIVGELFASNFVLNGAAASNGQLFTTSNQVVFSEYLAGIGFAFTNPANNAYANIIVGTLFQGSDRSLKTDIKALPYGLNEVMLLKPSAFKFAEDKSPGLGFIADDVQAILPELIHKDHRDLATLNYNGIIPVLVSAIQEQQRDITALKALIASK